MEGYAEFTALLLFIFVLGFLVILISMFYANQMGLYREEYRIKIDRMLTFEESLRIMFDKILKPSIDRVYKK